MVKLKMKIRCGMFEGGICHVKITQTFAQIGRGFYYLGEILWKPIY